MKRDSVEGFLATGALAGLLVALAVTDLAAQQALPQPSGDIVLTVTGAIQATNSGDRAEFDLEMLQALSAVTFTTTTIWTVGAQTFEGIPLAALLDSVGSDGGTLKASAINDYSVDIPVAEIDAQAPIIAYRLNGELIPRRGMGPLWIVYPYDMREEYRTEVAYSRSVWQLDRIEVNP